LGLSIMKFIEPLAEPVAKIGTILIQAFTKIKWLIDELSKPYLKAVATTVLTLVAALGLKGLLGILGFLTGAIKHSISDMIKYSHGQAGMKSSTDITTLAIEKQIAALNSLKLAGAASSLSMGGTAFSTGIGAAGSTVTTANFATTATKAATAGGFLAALSRWWAAPAAAFAKFLGPTSLLVKGLFSNAGVLFALFDTMVSIPAVLKSIKDTKEGKQSSVMGWVRQANLLLPLILATIGGVIGAIFGAGVPGAIVGAGIGGWVGTMLEPILGSLIPGLNGIQEETKKSGEEIVGELRGKKEGFVAATGAIGSMEGIYGNKNTQDQINLAKSQALLQSIADYQAKQLQSARSTAENTNTTARQVAGSREDLVSFNVSTLIKSPRPLINKALLPPELLNKNLVCN
jgi:hypothetical protein